MAIPIDLCSHCPHNGGVPQATTMPLNDLVRISKDEGGVNASINRQTRWQAVMVNGAPYCHMGTSLLNVENWLTTLEVLTASTSIPFAHRWHLQELKAMLEVAHDQHVKEHQEVVTEAPTADDQLAYLAAYAASISGGEV